MMRLTTLGIPLLIGLVAAGLNWQVLNKREAPLTFLRVKESVNAGTKVTERSLEVVELSGPAETLDQLKRTVVLAKDKSLIIGRPAIRDLQVNDLILWRDFVSARGELKKPSLPVPLEGVVLPERLLQVGDQIGFVLSRRGPPTAPGGLSGEPVLEEVGPFNVSSVGQLTNRLGLDSKETGGAGAAERTITIEVEYVDGKLSPNIQKLLTTRGDTNDARTPRLVAVVLRPQPRTVEPGK